MYIIFLTASVTMHTGCDGLWADIQELRGSQQEARELQEENAELKGEVQRLTKASADKVSFSSSAVLARWMQL